MNRAVLAGAVVVALSAAPAFAQSPDAAARGTQQKSGAAKSGTAKSGSAKAGSDQHFVMEAAKGGLAEVELGRLASQKGTSDQVKKFGQRMVDDHSKANDELKTVAQNKNITLPTSLDPKDKAFADRLSKMSGEQFDRAYMQHMLADHKKDVNAFRMESQSGKDADVKSFASKTLPTLEEHLKLAQDTSKAVGTSGAMAAGHPNHAKGAKGSKSKGSKGQQ